MIRRWVFFYGDGDFSRTEKLLILRANAVTSCLRFRIRFRLRYRLLYFNVRAGALKRKR